MSFETYLAGVLFLLTPVLLIVFLVKGVSLPPGPVVRVKDQPVRFTAGCALYLLPLFFQAFLLHREHPAAEHFFLFCLCVFNLFGALRTRAAVETRVSRYEFASAKQSIFATHRAQVIFWLLITAIVIAMIISDIASGRYPPLLGARG